MKSEHFSEIYQVSVAKHIAQLHILTNMFVLVRACMSVCVRLDGDNYIVYNG